MEDISIYQLDENGDFVTDENGDFVIADTATGSELLKAKGDERSRQMTPQVVEKVAAPLATLFAPWTVQGARQGAGQGEEIARGIGDAAMMFAPPALAMRGARVALPLITKGAGPIATKLAQIAGVGATEGAIAASGQALGDIATQGYTTPTAVAGQLAGPLALPAIGGAIGGARNLAQGGAVKLGEAVSGDLPLTGAILSATGKTAAEVQTPVAKASGIVATKLRPDAQEMIDVAKSLGIENEADIPASVLFGSNSPAAQAERTAQNAGDAAMTEKVNNAAMLAQEGYNKALQRIAGRENVLDAFDAGEMLREAIPQAIEDGVKSAGLRHSQVAERYPDLVVGKAAMQSAKDVLDGAITRAEIVAKRLGQGTSELSQLKAMREGLFADDVLTYAEANILRDEIGKKAFEKNPALARPTEISEALRGLYSSLDEAMIGSLRLRDKDAADALQKANATMSDIFKQRDILVSAYGNDAKAGEAIFRSATSDTKKYDALRALLSDDMMRQVSAAKLNDAYKRGIGDNVGWRGLDKVLGNNVVIKHALPEHELLQLRNLSKFGHAVDQSIPGTGRDKALSLVESAKEKAESFAGRVQGELSQQAVNRSVSNAPQVQTGFSLSSILRAGLRGPTTYDWLTALDEHNALYPTPTGGQ